MKTLKLLPLISLLALSSCAKDPCIDVTCLNDGVCDDGSCLCADWYEGEDCGTEQREKMLGEYIGSYFVCDSTFSIISGNLNLYGVLGNGDDINQFQFTQHSIIPAPVGAPMDIQFTLTENFGNTYSGSYYDSTYGHIEVNGEFNENTGFHRMELSGVTAGNVKWYRVNVYEKVQ